MEYITQEFKEYDWVKITDKRDQQIYTKNDREIALTISNDNIHLSFPLNNSPYNYVATLSNNDDYNTIHEYITDKLEYYEN